MALMLGWNSHIVNIARHHKYRIVNALFLITEQATRVREAQQSSLKRFQGFQAVVTLAQLLGTLFLLYSPYFAIMVVKSFTSNEIPVEVEWFVLVLLNLTPLNNVIIYAFKNKQIQLTCLNYLRKQYYKSQLNREISRRSPAPSSRRPSLSSLLSTFGGGAMATHLQSKLADIPGCTVAPGPHGPAAPHKRPPMRRYKSDLAWRSIITSGDVKALASEFNIGKRSESDHGQLSKFVSSTSLQVPLLEDGAPSGTVVQTNRQLIGKYSQPNSIDSPSSSNLNPYQDDVSVSRRESIRSDHSNHRIGESPTYHSDVSRNSSIEERDSIVSQVTRKRFLKLEAFQRRKSKDRPRITITRVPTVDQSDLEFVLDSKVINHTEVKDSGTGNNNTEDVNGVNHKLRIKLYNEKQKQTDGFISTSPTGKQTSPKHRVGSPIGKLFNFSIESSYEEKEEEIFLNMEKENIPIIPIVKLCFEDSNNDIVTSNGNPKIHHNEKSTESTIGKDNSVELIEFNSLDYSTKINTSNHANNSNEPKMNGNYVNDTKVEPDSCDTSFQQPFQTIDTLNETKHYSKIDENTLENGFHTPKEIHDNFSVVDETKPDSKVETNGHKYDNNDENSEDNHDKSIDTPEQFTDNNCDTNCTNIETALIMQRKKTAEARRNFFRESKNLHENGLNMME